MSTKKVVVMGVLTLAIGSTIFASISGSTTYRNAEDFAINRHYNSHYNGAIINLWKRNHHESQDWRFYSDNTIRSASNEDFCLNLHNYDLSNGAIINLWECNGHDSQKWVWNGNTIRPLGNPNYCLNLHNYDNSNGATINLWTCNGHASQNWYKVVHYIR
jgi:hypothetical protein